jgi:hypothetical protein
MPEDCRWIQGLFLWVFQYRPVRYGIQCAFLLTTQTCFNRSSIEPCVCRTTPTRVIGSLRIDKWRPRRITDLLIGVERTNIRKNLGFNLSKAPQPVKLACSRNSHIALCQRGQHQEVQER